MSACQLYVSSTEKKTQTKMWGKGEGFIFFFVKFGHESKSAFAFFLKKKTHQLLQILNKGHHHLLGDKKKQTVGLN